ncbi:hypothetical protein MSKU15_1003 [Komagataeibacter diospyri]|nr:hypothetical protein MSKU15_1003 [Komagataeibacter diospyri]
MRNRWRYSTVRNRGWERVRSKIEPVQMYGAPGSHLYCLYWRRSSAFSRLADTDTYVRFSEFSMVLPVSSMTAQADHRRVSETCEKQIERLSNFVLTKRQ